MGYKQCARDRLLSMTKGRVGITFIATLTPSQVFFTVGSNCFHRLHSIAKKGDNVFGNVCLFLLSQLVRYHAEKQIFFL